MTSRKRSNLQSWIRPQFGWAVVPDIFVVDVPVDDPDVVEFISTGCREVPILSSKKALQTVIALIDGERLSGQLQAAVWDNLKLRPKISRLQAGMKVTAYCWGAFLHPGKERLRIVVGRSKPADPNGWISSGLKRVAYAALAQHHTMVAEFEKEMVRIRQHDDEFYKRPGMAGGRAMAEHRQAIKGQNERPILTAECLHSELPQGVLFDAPRTNDPRKLDDVAIGAVAVSGSAPSRDGAYTGIVPSKVRPGTMGLVTWTPHTGLPSYPEVRAALKIRLPSAFKKPLDRGVGRPELDSGLVSDVDTGLLQGHREPGELFRELSDLRLDQPDAARRAEELDAERSECGFDAIAWYQPHHAWTEGAWGIFFDARKLDDLAYSLHRDFTAESIRASHGFAAFLAFNLTYTHEMFHARVEAALSWLELTSLQPRHLRYGRDVYNALRETPEWLEEALANWSAWQWFKSDAAQSLFGQRTSNPRGIERVVEAALDLSPAGYKDWRVGATPSIWRTFATQLSTGRPKTGSPRIGLPIESILTGPLGYDFRPIDVPLRFLGQGVIADLLQSRPASLNVPSRREIERALKHFGHEVDPSGGKGGHQKWTGPDRRAFILPTRDPVSHVVFKSLLNHLGVDKASYVRDVRPNL